MFDLAPLCHKFVFVVSRWAKIRHDVFKCNAEVGPLPASAAGVGNISAAAPYVPGSKFASQ